MEGKLFTATSKCHYGVSLKVSNASLHEYEHRIQRHPFQEKARSL